MSVYTYRQATVVPLRQQVAESGISLSSGQELALADSEWDSEPHVLVYVCRVA
jgi:hypothetical protein